MRQRAPGPATVPTPADPARAASVRAITEGLADVRGPLLPVLHEVVEAHGVRLFIDPKAMMFILGTEMDYVEEQLQSGFVFRNPNEKGRCGCGESFHV